MPIPIVLPIKIKIIIIQVLEAITTYEKRCHVGVDEEQRCCESHQVEGAKKFLAKTGINRRRPANSN
jgi:hypothetical protein